MNKFCIALGMLVYMAVKAGFMALRAYFGKHLLMSKKLPMLLVNRGNACSK